MVGCVSRCHVASGYAAPAAERSCGDVEEPGTHLRGLRRQEHVIRPQVGPYPAATGGRGPKLGVSCQNHATHSATAGPFEGKTGGAHKLLVLQGVSLYLEGQSP
jgi:hypothetical protein